MDKESKIFYRIFLLLAAGAVLGVALFEIIKENKQENLGEWLKISVVDIKPKIPPEMMIEVENTGHRVIGLSHFRLTFMSGNEIICLVSEDIGNFRPGEKKTIWLKCSEFRPKLGFSSDFKIIYFLQAFPEMKIP